MCIKDKADITHNSRLTNDTILAISIFYQLTETNLKENNQSVSLLIWYVT